MTRLEAPQAYFQTNGPTLTLICQRIEDGDGGRLHLELIDRSRPGEPRVIALEHFDFSAPGALFEPRSLSPEQQIELRDLACEMRDQLTAAGHIPLQDPHNTHNQVGATDSANYAYSADTDAQWPLPTPVPDYPVAPFPLLAMPAWIRDFVAAVSHSTQTPPDLGGVLVLAALAVAAAKVVEIEVTPDWSEPANLYVVIALSPGERKSAVVKQVIAPILDEEHDRCIEYARELPRREMARRKAATRLQRAEQAAFETTDGQPRAAAERDVQGLASELQQLAILPPPPRLLADDTTAEAVTTLLCQHGRIAVVSAEGGELFALMRGRYSRAGEANFGVYLRGHSGDPIRVDRKGRPPEQAERPALSLGLAVQPSALAGLMLHVEARGRGLHGRFLYSVPESLIGRRNCDTASVPESVRMDYNRSLRALLRYAIPRNERGIVTPHLLSLHSAAREVHLEFQRWLEPQMAIGGKLAHLTDWAGKLAGAVVRLAGLLHMAAHVSLPTPWDVPIQRETMEQAIVLGQYFLSHTQAAYGVMGADPAIEGVHRLLKWIQTHNRTTFSARDCFNALRSSDCPNMKAIKPVLDLAEQYNYIRRQVAPERQGPGRRPAPVFTINPHISRGNPDILRNL